MGNCKYCNRPLTITKNGYLICVNSKAHPDNKVYVPGRPR